MEITIKTLHEDLLKLQRELELIKKMLLSEGKLTPYAKNELTKARAESEDSYTELEDL